MVKDIKLKAISTKTGKWIYGTGVTDFRNISPVPQYCLWSKYSWVPIHIDTICKFTGKTLNGVDVYEGDRLSGYPHGDTVVEWSEEHGGFFTGEYLLSNELEDCKDGWMVVGSIYDKEQ